MWLLEIAQEIAGETCDIEEKDTLLGISIDDALMAAHDCIQSAWAQCEGWPEREVKEATSETISVIYAKDAVRQAKESVREERH
jgi:hypothetical protein